MSATTLIQAQKSSWVYTEGWWDISSTPDSEESIQESGFVLTNEGRLTLNVRTVAELNPGQNIHGFEQGMTLIDQSTQESVAIANTNYFYTTEGSVYTSTLSYEVSYDGSGLGGGPYQLRHIAGGDLCPGGGSSETQPPVDFGASFMRYEYTHTRASGVHNFVHSSHPPPSVNTCPTRCAFRVPSPLDVYSEGFPGLRQVIIVPWGPLGCLAFGPGTNRAIPLACFDLTYSSN